MMVYEIIPNITVNWAGSHPLYTLKEQAGARGPFFIAHIGSLSKVHQKFHTLHCQQRRTEGL